MITKQQIIERLNKALVLDPNLIEKLCNTRYPVSQAYMDSDEFVYGENDSTGLLGVLNGLVGDLDSSRIAGYYDDSDKLTHFVLVEVKDGQYVK
jgi:hypothetical protein